MFEVLHDAGWPSGPKSIMNPPTIPAGMPTPFALEGSLDEHGDRGSSLWVLHSQQILQNECSQVDNVHREETSTVRNGTAKSDAVQIGTAKILKLLSLLIKQYL